MPRPSRNGIYESVIRRMVNEALEEQEMNFSKDHALDSDEQLLVYIRRQASDLGYAPRYKEIIGWKLIEKRFGSWGCALERAGLPIHTSCPVSKLPRIRMEVEKQKELYRKKKAEKKLKARQRIKEQNLKRKQNERASIAFVYPLAQMLYIEKLSDCPLDSFLPSSMPPIARWAALRKPQRQPSLRMVQIEPRLTLWQMRDP